MLTSAKHGRQKTSGRKRKANKLALALHLLHSPDYDSDLPSQPAGQPGQGQTTAAVTLPAMPAAEAAAMADTQNGAATPQPCAPVASHDAVRAHRPRSGPSLLKTALNQAAQPHAPLQQQYQPAQHAAGTNTLDPNRPVGTWGPAPPFGTTGVACDSSQKWQAGREPLVESPAAAAASGADSPQVIPDTPVSRVSASPEQHSADNSLGPARSAGVVQMADEACLAVPCVELQQQSRAQHVALSVMQPLASPFPIREIAFGGQHELAPAGPGEMPQPAPELQAVEAQVAVQQPHFAQPQQGNAQQTLQRPQQQPREEQRPPHACGQHQPPIQQAWPARREQPRDLPEDVPRAKRQKSSEQPVKHRLSRTTPEGMDMSGPGEWQKPLPQLEEQQRHQHQHRLVQQQHLRQQQPPPPVQTSHAQSARKHSRQPQSGKGHYPQLVLQQAPPASGHAHQAAHQQQLGVFSRRAQLPSAVQQLAAPVSATAMQQLAHIHVPYGAEQPALPNPVPGVHLPRQPADSIAAAQAGTTGPQPAPAAPNKQPPACPLPSIAPGHVASAVSAVHMPLHPPINMAAAQHPAPAAGRLQAPAPAGVCFVEPAVTSVVEHPMACIVEAPGTAAVQQPVLPATTSASGALPSQGMPASASTHILSAVHRPQSPPPAAHHTLQPLPGLLSAQAAPFSHLQACSVAAHVAHAKHAGQVGRPAPGKLPAHPLATMPAVHAASASHAMSAMRTEGAHATHDDKHVQPPQQQQRVSVTNHEHQTAPAAPDMQQQPDAFMHDQRAVISAAAAMMQQQEAPCTDHEHRLAPAGPALDGMLHAGQAPGSVPDMAVRMDFQKPVNTGNAAEADALVVPTPPLDSTPAASGQKAPGCALNAHQPSAQQGAVISPATRVSQNPLKLEAYLTPEVVAAFALKHDLYPWQGECLNLPGVLGGRNLVFSAPTSAGKSLIAETLMLRRSIITGKMSLLVLPYNALCQEKTQHLSHLYAPLGKRVAANYGGLGKRDDLNTDVGCLVCTIERANVLVNRLIEEDRLDDLCCIVVDEVHMADDATRGYLLELLLTKVQFKMASVSGDSQSQGGVQLVAMSATVPNMAAIARWLNAALYETEFRPVQLKRFLKVGHTIRDQDLEIIRTLPQDERFSSLHPPTAEMLAVAQLCEETVQGGHSVLVFCGTKRACEQVAKVIGSKLTVPERQLKCAGEDLPADRADVLARLAKLQADHPLIPVMSQGVAYHNSSLSHDERELVEAAFKTGAISVLVATSTVATGVNLPARRVIIKDRYQGLDRKESYLSSATYHQMCGRAGRAGIDSQGEAIIFARSGDYQDVAAMMREGAQPISSCLAEERRGLKHAMQEVVATGAVRTAADCQNYCKCTLLAATTDPKIVVSAFRAAGKWLADNGLITWVSEKDTGYYQPTALGKATLVSGMSLEEALVVKEEIERAHHGFVMSTDLHLTYLITPFREDIGIDWDVFHAAYSNLKGPDAKVAELVGIKQSFVISQMRCKGQRKNMTEAHKESERICKRFLAALVLNDLIQEMNLDDVVEKYKVNKAGVRAMQERAGSFAMMLAAFCGRMGWGNMETIMAKFQSRVSHGVRPEIVELIRIDGIKAYRARQLYSAGLRTPAEVALSTVHQLTRIFEQGARGGNEAEQKEAAKRAAWKVYKAARLLAQEELREEQAKNEKLRLNLAACDSQGSTPAGSIKTPAKTPTQSLTARIQDHTKGLVLVEGLTMIKSFCERWVRQKQYAFAIDVRGSTTPEAEREAMKASLPKGPGIASSAGKPALAVRSGPRIAGVAVCWDRERAFYILLPAQNAAEAWKVVMEALSGPAEKITHDLKPQLVGLLQAAISQDGPQPADPLVDVRIAAWMLAPDGDIDNVSAVSDNPACKRVIRSGIGALPLEALLESRAGAAVVAEAKQTLQQDPGQKPDAFKGDRLAACKRAVLSFRLFERLQPQMQVQGLLPPLAKVEMLIVRVLAHMEHIGIAADPDVFTQNDEPLRRRQEELEVKAVALVARSFNLDSPKEVSMVLFEVLKLPVPPYAQKLKGGQYSTCDKVLQELMTQHAIVPVISEHRMVSKVRGSFHDDYMPVISRQATGSAGSGIAAALARSQQEAPVAGEQGRKTRVLARIHGSFFQTATATGRLAMGDPNLQCVPKPRSFEVTVTQASKDTQEQTWRTHTTNLRAAFVAERGFVLLSADYNQIELRIMAHFSGDEALCKLLCDLSQDPFRNLAAQWLKLPLEQVKPEQRDHAKALSYGLLYGKGPHALAADLDCTPNDAVKHMDSFFASIPGVKAWTKSLVEECRKTTFIQTLAGRRRYLPGIGEQGPGASAERAAAERKAINSFCQGSAADMIKLAMINVHAELASSFPADACRLILQIHDELLFEVRAGVLPEAARLVRRCMEGVVSFRVPLPVKLHSGPSWGELEPFHLD